MIYFHDNDEDIGEVLGHWIDLASQLEWNVLIPELSGFGAYNKEFKSTTCQKTILNKWISDANNAIQIAKELLNTESYENIIVYSKGVSTSIILKLLNLHQLKNLVFENINSDIDTMNKYFKMKAIKLSKSWYSQIKKSYILDNLNCIKSINFKSKTQWKVNSNFENRELPQWSINKANIDSISDWDYKTHFDPKSSIPRILFVSRDSLHQRVMTNDVIWAMLSKIYNVENWKPSVRIEKVIKEFKSSLASNGREFTEQNCSEWIKHVMFKSSDSADFKKEHRHMFLESLRWISY